MSTINVQSTTGSEWYAIQKSEPPRVDPEVVAQFKIRKIDNGFLVHFGNYEIEPYRTMYAQDLTEVGNIVIKFLVEQRLEK